jgi:steroid delta-isomerase-like uncharacterized protein
MLRGRISLALLLGAIVCAVQAQEAQNSSSGTSDARRNGSMTTTEINRKVIEDWVELFNRGDIDGTIELFAEDGQNFGRPVGRDGVRVVLADIYTRFPDVKVTVHEWVADGDWIAFRATYSGTHRGVGRLPVDGGMLIGVPPTNRSFAVLHMHMFRLENGLIKEHWGARDDIGMMRQLGLLPPAAPPPQ